MSTGNNAALPFYGRAIELDPNFAIALTSLGIVYHNMRQQTRSEEMVTRAYELRDHASATEASRIRLDYQMNVIGDLDQALATNQEWQASYPREYFPVNRLTVLYGLRGQLEKSRDSALQEVQLLPSVTAYLNAELCLRSSGQFAEARAMIDEAVERKFMSQPGAHRELLAVALSEGDAGRMAKETAWLDSNHQSIGPDNTMAMEIRAGRLKALNERARQADANPNNLNSEATALQRTFAGLIDAAVGYVDLSRQQGQTALDQGAGSRDVKSRAAFVYALAGDATRATTLADELNKSYPQDTLIKAVWLPMIRAQAALSRHDAPGAIDVLGAPTAYELSANTAYPVCMYPVYVRGQAYLAARQGAAAAREFQRILDHPGHALNSCWAWTLAELGLGRAYALTAQTSSGADAETAGSKARAAYESFLTWWKDADPDIPLLRAARSEFAALPKGS